MTDKTQAETLRQEYRATMPADVLHLWAKDAIACIQELEAQATSKWLHCADAAHDPALEKPEAGRYVLAWTEGAKVPIRAMWTPQFFLEMADDDAESGEYSEAKDQYFCPEGWYENNAHEETHWNVDRPVIAWMELPRLDAVLQAAPPAPAAVAVPAESQRLAQFLLNMQTRLGSCREACGDEYSMKAWDDYSRAAALLAAKGVLDEREMFEAWVRTHENAHGAFDDWSARAGWEARASLAEAPALASDTESVLIDGIAYEVPAAVAGELLSLHLDLLAAAPAHVVPESHTLALEAIATWPVTDMLMNMDAANMRGIAQRALATTQAQGKVSLEHFAPAQEHATQLAGQATISAEPDAWAAVVFGGKRNGKIYSTCDTKPQCESYIGVVEQSNDSITLVARPVFLGAAPAQAQEDAPIVWPKSRDVGRIGDMSTSASIRVGLDGDNDTYVNVWDENGGASIEFCTPGAGGGKSSRTRVALLALMVAMEADNAEDPRRDWWAASAAQGGA